MTESPEPIKPSIEKNPAANRKKFNPNQAFNPMKSAQDAVEGFFKERDTEGEAIQQSPRWMRATSCSLTMRT